MHPSSVVNNGSFLSDGNWIDSGHFRGKVDHLVQDLVRDRRQDLLSPDRAARAIVEAGCEQAFPNHAYWAVSSRWPLVQSSTSAEEAVKRGGMGSDNERHWCRGCWISGLEKHCPEPAHRERPLPEEVSRLIKTLSGVFE